MKKILTLMLMTAIGALLCLQCTRDKLIPVTTASEKARALYNEATIAFDDNYYDKYVNLLVEALKEDPDFFLANYDMAMYCLYYENKNRFMEYGKKASKCEAILSEGEIIMKDALSQLLKKSDSDVTAFGKKLVKLFPEDVKSYYQLFFFYRFIKDTAGQERTLKSALEVAGNKAPIYNWLGYTYINLNRNDEALASFDKYVELKPSLPNAYDSKGDYYMYIKDYRKAYDNFMKANAIDSTWSFSKAMNAKNIADSLGL